MPASAPRVGQAPQVGVGGKRFEFKGPCRLSCRVAGSGSPVLLVHDVGFTAGATEMLPLFESLQGSHQVFLLDLPGFGASDRAERRYSARLMTDALHMAAAFVRMRAQLPGRHPLDVVALGRSCEFVARAATEDPKRWGRLAFVSPTGLHGPLGGWPARRRRWLRAGFMRQPLHALLTTQPLLRWQLRRQFGNPFVDEDLLAAAVQSSRVPGASAAPFQHWMGALDSPDVLQLYLGLKHQVWLSFGKRGLASGFHQNPVLEQRANWRHTVFTSGTLPHFQHTVSFVRVFRRFLSETAPPA
jgi:pimeloyl-ACP methyl ester carboxylesterase